MALTFLQKPKTFGQSFSEGLGQSLQNLAASRLQKIERQNEQSDFVRKLRGAYPDYSEPEAEFIASQPLEQRLKFLESAPSAQQPSQSQQPTIAGAANQQRAQELQQTQANQLPSVDQLSKFAQGLGYEITPEKQQEMQAKLEELKNNPQAFDQLKQQYAQGIENGDNFEVRKNGFEGQAKVVGNPQEQQQSAQPLRRFQKPKTNMEKIAERTANIKEQSAIDKSNAEWKDRIKEKAADVIPVRRVAGEIRDLIKQPGIQWGTISSLTPDRLQNAQTQALVSKMKQLVTLRAQVGKGVASETRLKMEELAKPQLWQKPKAIEYLVDSIINDTDEDILPVEIMNQIINENDGFEPRNLENKTNIRTIIQQLPDASEYQPGTEIKVKNYKFAKKGNQWVPQ